MNGNVTGRHRHSYHLEKLKWVMRVEAFVLPFIAASSVAFGQAPVPVEDLIRSANAIRPSDIRFIVLDLPVVEPGKPCFPRGMFVKITKRSLALALLDALRHATTTWYVRRDGKAMLVNARGRPCNVAIYYGANPRRLSHLVASFAEPHARRQLGPRFAALLPRLKAEAVDLGCKMEMPSNQLTKEEEEEARRFFGKDYDRK